MPSGGPRTPNKPAPVSGPGRLSRRTDGGPGQKVRDLPNAAYGEGGEFRDIQSSAAMSLASGALTPSQGMPAGPVPVTPFDAPTQYPGQAVTSGAAMGAGPGMEALGISQESPEDQDRRQLLSHLPTLEFLANQPTAMPSLRTLVRQIKAVNGI